MDGPGKIRLLLADDHPQVLEQLASRLSHEPDFELVAAVRNSRAALRAALEERPNLLLVDPMMRDGHGLSTLRHLLAELPEMAIVVLTAVIDTSLEVELRSLGVFRLLAKGISSAELLKELRAAVGRP